MIIVFRITEQATEKADNSTFSSNNFLITEFESVKKVVIVQMKKEKNIIKTDVLISYFPKIPQCNSL